MGKRRPKLPKAVKEDLIRFFGGCRNVLAEHPLDATWHHVDSDPSNNRASNIVPIDWKTNDFLGKCWRRVRGGAPPDLIPEVAPRHLLRSASAQFTSRWDGAAAYGCAKLASSVSRDYLREDHLDTLSCCLASLYYLRYRYHPGFIKDVLGNDILPLLRHPEGLSFDAAFCVFKELVNLLTEHGCIQEAASFYSIWDTSKIRDLRRVEDRTIAGFLGRHAQTQVITGKLHSPFLDETLEANPKDENTKATIANARAWHFLVQGNYREAREAVEELVESHLGHIEEGLGAETESLLHFWKPRTEISAWNMAELLRAYSVAAGRTDRRSLGRAKRAFVASEWIYSKMGVRPYEVMPNFWQQFGDLWLSFEISRPFQRPPLSGDTRDLIAACMIEIKSALG